KGSRGPEVGARRAGHPLDDPELVGGALREREAGPCRGHGVPGGCGREGLQGALLVPARTAPAGPLQSRSEDPLAAGLEIDGRGHSETLPWAVAGRTERCGGSGAKRAEDPVSVGPAGRVERALPGAV